MPNPYDYRDPFAGVSPLFVERWSPRAFDSTPIDPDTLQRVMDAARWSPSCFNEQPWRFHTATDATFDQFVELLQEGNRGWAQHAGVIGFLSVLTRFRHNGKANASAELDCGAAWMAMSLQARMEGLYTHAMAGIDHAAADRYFGLDGEQQRVLIGFVIGYPADRGQLPDNLRQREQPSARKPLAEIWQRY
nr:nitroreductase family protein [Motiliproteus sediminis]